MDTNTELNEGKNWMARIGLDQDSLCGAIETVIFISERPIKAQKIRDHIDSEGQMPLQEVNKALERLQREYEQSHRGICLMEVAGGFQFRTKEVYAKFAQGLFKGSALVLSPVALEVLAIIAYRGPLSRAEIDRIRGVDSSHILRALMDRRLVAAKGRSDELGRPVTYGTTNEFLEMFNLSSLEDLPPEHELQALADNQDVGDISDIKELVSSSTDLQKTFYFDELKELNELDELAQAIKGVKADTPFTKSIRSNERPSQGQDVEASKDGIPEDRKSAFDLLEEFVSREERPERILEDQEGELEQALDKAFAKLTAQDEGQGSAGKDELAQKEKEDVGAEHENSSRRPLQAPV